MKIEKLETKKIQQELKDVFHKNDNEFLTSKFGEVYHVKIWMENWPSDLTQDTIALENEVISFELSEKSIHESLLAQMYATHISKTSEFLQKMVVSEFFSKNLIEEYEQYEVDGAPTVARKNNSSANIIIPGIGSVIISWRLIPTPKFSQATTGDK